MTDALVVPIPLSRNDIKAKYAHRNPAVVLVLQWFANAHLSPDLQALTYQSQKLAFIMVDNIEDSPELTDGLRGLLRAKDSFVRAYLINEDK